MKYTSFSSQNANSYRWYPIFSFHINQLKCLLCKTSRHSLIQKCDIDPEARHLAEISCVSCARPPSVT